MRYSAHSPPKDFPDLAPHGYSDHVQEVLDYGLAKLDNLLKFSSFSEEEKNCLRESFIAAAMLHDMGKLDEGNQPVLKGGAGRLAIDHMDAGIAIAQMMDNQLVAWLIRGHHAPGLPSRSVEKYFIKYLNKEVNKANFKLPNLCLRGLRHQRSEEFLVRQSGGEEDCHIRHYNLICHTDYKLPQYQERQLESCGPWPELEYKLPPDNLTIRLLLSCLVDADHGSAAAYGNNEPPQKYSQVDGRWQQRLDSLKKYISQKAEQSLPEERERNVLRQAFFEHCCQVEMSNCGLTYCSAPVGLGKTTSVTAFLLRQAAEMDANRLIVIAPFTNIINQTVKSLRKALVLDGEDPEKIVAAHHHKVDFTSEKMRQYNTLWRAPVVVTTAVQFFETLASADPVSLRKLSGIVGSVIFIDESHACVPPEFFRVTWRWLHLLAQIWGCRIVLSSGSMIEFWNDEFLVGQELQAKLPDLLSNELRIACQAAEQSRIVLKRLEKAFTKLELVEKLLDEQIWEYFQADEFQSCLVILNTVQSAAVIAHILSKSLDDTDVLLANRKVLHLSTALSPVDRDVILSEVERRQAESNWSHKRWFLVATSCVEAGVDFDFSIAFRECCSVTSLLQVSGRVNRHGVRSCGYVYDFKIKQGDGLTLHPGFKESSAILSELWPELLNSRASLTEISTRAVKKQFSVLAKNVNLAEKMLENELRNNFQEVQDTYRLISADTRTVITDQEIAAALELGIPVSWQIIQNHSVQLWSSKIEDLRLHPIKNAEDEKIYSWVSKYEYDPDFLGIMAGMIKIEEFFQRDYGVI